MSKCDRNLFPGLVLALAASVVQAAGAVSVKFVEPDKFADARDTRHDASDNLRVLAGHIGSAAGRYLADGDRLDVEVLDVDLAGEIWPSRHGLQVVRLLKGGADFPRIKLRYTLESSGQTARSGELTISDMAYLQRSGGPHTGDALGHERRMLDGWFQSRLGARGAAGPVPPLN